jgi:hypothetical protein
MKRSAVLAFILFVFLMAGERSGSAQAVEAMDGRGFYINAGAMASGFMPGDYDHPVGATPEVKVYQPVIGPGVYVDLHFAHWVQIEAEGRWMLWDGYGGETQDNYLIGPRVPIHRLGRRGQIYGKALIGLAKMNFSNIDLYTHGSFTALAFGGTLDYKLTRKLTLRAVDFEYQYWPVWVENKSLQPYGVSVGMAYRVF